MIPKEACIYEKRTTIRHPEVLIGCLCLDLPDKGKMENTHPTPDLAVNNIVK